MTLEILTSDLLAGVRHGFFTRKGGASSGIFAGSELRSGLLRPERCGATNRAPGRRRAWASRPIGFSRSTRSIPPTW